MSRGSVQKRRAIILRTVKHSESDLIVHALSSEGEFLSLMAKSALKSKKRFGGGVLEPTHCVNLTYKAGREDRMHFLNEAKLEKDFSGIRSDLDRLNLAMHFLQVIRRVSQEGDLEQRSLFNILGHALQQLETCKDIRLLKMQFEVKLLDQQGVLPPLDDYRVFAKHSLTEVDSLKVPQGDLTRLRAGIELALSNYLT